MEPRPSSLPELPAGYEWGAWSGDYIPVMRDGQKVCAFGGVVCKVTPESDWPAVLAYVIAKGERQLERT